MAAFETEHSALLKMSSAAFYACSSFLITVVNKIVLTNFSSDLAFDIEAYTFILLNDFFTAANNVYTKKKLGSDGLGKYGVLYYNAVIIVIPTILASVLTGDLNKAIAFENWGNPTFTICFLLTCIMGFVLMYSIVLCSHYNSALTTTVVGAIKNVAVAYIGMFVGGDYLFSWPNFLGLSICMSGGLVYSYFTFYKTAQTEDPEKQQSILLEDTLTLSSKVGDK